MNKIIIDRTEQWEYTAYGYGMQATGSSETSAELNLLRKVVDKMEITLETIMEFGRKNSGKGFSCSELAKKGLGL